MITRLCRWWLARQDRKMAARRAKDPQDRFDFRQPPTRASIVGEEKALWNLVNSARDIIAKQEQQKDRSGVKRPPLPPPRMIH